MRLTGAFPSESAVESRNGIGADILLGKIATQESLHLICESTMPPLTGCQERIKRALFKSVGRSLCRRAGGKKHRALFERDYEIDAYMSAVDGGCGRLVWIAKPQPKRGLQVLQALLHGPLWHVRFVA